MIPFVGSQSLPFVIFRVSITFITSIPSPIPFSHLLSPYYPLHLTLVLILTIPARPLSLSLLYTSLLLSLYLLGGNGGTVQTKAASNYLRIKVKQKNGAANRSILVILTNAPYRCDPET